MSLELLANVNLGRPAGQLRAAPVKLGPRAEPAFVAVHGVDFDVDPWHEMFFFPKGTLELAVFTVSGELVWKRDLGRGVVPGMWFCPVYPLDLNGDGIDEIWFVGNPDVDHPLGLKKYRLFCLDAANGEELGNWPWPSSQMQSMSHAYRNFIVGGQVHGQPALVTAQGTYGTMHLQCWNPGMVKRWEHVFPVGGPGSLGSHMAAIVDWNSDGIDELFWGEHLLELDCGTELMCVDPSYQGHSDIVQPVRHPETRKWFVYTCRESDPGKGPRVALWDSLGKPVWGDLEDGHIDMGWVANLGGQPLAMAIKIQGKTLGPGGRFHQGNEEFVYDLFTGKRLDLGFPCYRTLPVDTDGDGQHELVRGLPGGDGARLNAHGEVMQLLGGTTAMASKFCDLPGEQILMYTEAGSVQIWYDPAARDTPTALERYGHPFYLANQRLCAVGYNLVNLGGLL